MVGVVVFASGIYCVIKGELEDIRRGFVIFLNSFVIGLKYPLSYPIYSILFFSKKKKSSSVFLFTMKCVFYKF